METTKQLRARMQDRSRAARHLLAEKGARHWSANDQSAFDALIADHERTQELLDARLSEGSVLSAMWTEQHKALDLFIRKSPKDRTDAEVRLVRNTMSTGTPSQGGYAVGPVVAQNFVDLMKGYGWMRQVADSYTTTNGAPGTIASSDGTGESGELLAENASATALDPSFAAVSMPTYKFGSKVFTVPMELLQDSAIDVVDLVWRRARARIGRTMNQKFTLGTGTGEPTGLVPAASVGKTGTTGQTVTIIYDDLADMADSVDEAQLGMPDTQADLPQTLAGWMFSQTMRKVIRKLKDANGRPIWTPSYDDGVTLPTPAQLLDYPVYINNDMAVPAVNAKSLAFGNLRSYTIRDALVVNLLRFDDSAFVSKGQVGFLAFARAGGNLADSGAVKLYQHSAT